MAGAKSKLSLPSTEYAQALANPFTGPLATIPDFPSVPSRRTRVFSRGFFSTGTAGIGYVCSDPYMGSRSDVPCVAFSSSAYAGSSFNTNPATTGVLNAFSNSDYANADFGTGTNIRGRVVCAGLRIRYSSTSLNRGGTVLGLITPNHNGLDTLTFGTVDNYECSGRFTPSEKWISVTYCPVYAEELTFDIWCGSPANGASIFPIMGFIVQSPAAGTTITFQYEYSAVYEFQGINVRGLVPSLADPNGFAAVQSTVQQGMMRPHDQDPARVGDKLVTAASHVASHTISGWLGRAEKSAVKWIESNGASILGDVLAFI